MYIVAENTKPDADIIAQAIRWNEQKKADRYDVLANYYLGHHFILNRIRPGTDINNRLVVNHAKYITDTNVGYLLGNPVEYQPKEDSVKLDPITEQYNNQDIALIDTMVAKSASKFGIAYDYTYALPNNDLHTKSIDPRNCIVVYDDTLEHQKLFAIMYSWAQVKARSIKVYGVKIIDAQNITFWDEDLILQPEYTVQHAFGVVPVVEYHNNEECQGDYEQVLSLIDAYNILESDRINDKEQLVNALLILKNMKLTPNQMESVKTNRVLSIAANSDISYLVKQLDETSIETLRSVLEQEIHKVSMTPNLSDQNFVGNSSGVAIKYKLLPFEQNTKNKERFFRKGLADRLSIYASYYKRLNKIDENFDVNKIDMIFKRNLPQNDFETSQMILNLDGLVSKETLVGQLSFVKDATKEVEWAEKEAMETANAESNAFGTTNASDNSNSSAQE